MKQCLKVAVSLVALSQFSIAQECRPITVGISWESDFTEICIRKACAIQWIIAGGISLTIRGGYQGGQYYQTANGKGTTWDIGKQCSDDGVFCLEFYSPGKPAILHYAGREFDLGLPSRKEILTRSMGNAEYWNCI
jgi:hypothetical protein